MNVEYRGATKKIILLFLTIVLDDQFNFRTVPRKVYVYHRILELGLVNSWEFLRIVILFIYNPLMKTSLADSSLSGASHALFCHAFPPNLIIS